MNPQEQFEALYADYTQTPIEQVVAARLVEDSYSLPAISKAWVWYKFGHAFGMIDIIEEMSLNQGEK